MRRERRTTAGLLTPKKSNVAERAGTEAVQAEGVATAGEDRIGNAVDAVRDRFGDEAIVRGRGFGKTLRRQGPSKLD